MTILTSELRKAIEEAGDQPVQVVDPETNRRYVLLRADIYERLHLVFEQGPLSKEEQRVLPRGRQACGWDDPEMDVYNDLAPR